MPSCTIAPARKPQRRGSLLAPTVLLVAACGSAPALDSTTLEPEPDEELSGGVTTIFDTTRDAFARPLRNLSDEHRNEFSLGDHFFNRNWITAPSSTVGDDGLGPVFNAVSCSACHFKDGRAAPPQTSDEEWIGLVMRLSVEGEDQHGGPLPEPNYGLQFNQHAILGVPGEGRISVTYEEIAGAFLDGEPYSLRRPIYSFAELSFGPLAPDTKTAPRIARAIFGLGLLQAVDEAEVLANADENDANGDFISGRPNFVWNRRLQRSALGRFGWKANRATVEEQSAGAFLEDIGVTTSLFPVDNCMPIQAGCLSAPNGGAPELDDDKLLWISHYVDTLAVPARRNWADAEVLRGKSLFFGAGCTGCHVPKVVTGTVEGFPELSNQTIRPYSDMLLHDLGEGLAVDRREYGAEGSEWRTPPLWGIGLVQTVNKHTFLLHDGRARGFAEAILWHGGEAIRPRERFRAMPRADRDALVKFLESL